MVKWIKSAEALRDRKRLPQSLMASDKAGESLGATLCLCPGLCVSLQAVAGGGSPGGGVHGSQVQGSKPSGRAGTS